MQKILAATIAVVSLSASAAAQSVRPEITITYGGAERAKVEHTAENKFYHNIEFTASANGAHAAVAAITRLCRLTQQNACDAQYDFRHELPVGWHRNEFSFTKLDLGTVEFIPFTVTPDSKLRVFSEYHDNTFEWGADIPAGKYLVELTVRGADATKTSTFVMDWFGSIESITAARWGN